MTDTVWPSVACAALRFGEPGYWPALIGRRVAEMPPRTAHSGALLPNRLTVLVQVGLKPEKVSVWLTGAPLLTPVITAEPDWLITHVAGAAAVAEARRRRPGPARPRRCVPPDCDPATAPMPALALPPLPSAMRFRSPRSAVPTFSR